MERTGPARANTCNKESVSILISIIVLSPGVNLKQCNPVLIIYIVLKLCRTRDLPKRNYDMESVQEQIHVLKSKF